MPTIKVDLSASSIDRALQELEAYQKKIEKLGENVVKRLTEDGKKTAQDIAMYMNAYDTGELVSGIVSDYSDGKGYIRTTAPHSAYVEFGTGVVGSGSPHPQASEYWAYDVNEHGVKGWFYIGRDGKRHWTNGMPSRPFMYDTAQTLRESVQYVVEDELNHD